MDVNGIVRADQLIVNTLAEVPDEVSTSSLGEVILDSLQHQHIEAQDIQFKPL